MTYSHRNIAETVEVRVRYETLRCTVARLKTDPLYAQVYAFTGDLQDLMTNYHEWPGRDGGIQGGACLHCGKTLKEVRVRVNPKTGAPVRGIAREIWRSVGRQDLSMVTFTDTGRRDASPS